MNEYAANLSVFICAFIEFVLIGYIYGNKYKSDVWLNDFFFYSFQVLIILWKMFE